MKREIAGLTVEFEDVAVSVETYKVGMLVRICIKEYSAWKTWNGIITQIDPFKNNPAITVMYVYSEYTTPELRFKTIVAGSEDAEVCPVRGDAKLCEDTALTMLHANLDKARIEVEVLEARLAAFQKALVAKE